MPKVKVTASQNTQKVDTRVAIFAQNLSYVYNQKTTFCKKALDDVTVTVNKGEFVAIVGHTGSGKTTFVQHLNALIRAQSGSLVVLGQDLCDKKVDLKQLRHDVGMVFQYPEQQLFADTVLQDVCFGPHNFGLDDDACKQLAQNALQLVGLDYQSVKNKSPFDLSGGEKRRVALAGVLATNPQILVMDEPTAGLDPRGKSEILSLVKKLNKEQGITVIMVSHDMNEVYENADRVLVFNQGKIIYDLPPVQLFSKEKEIQALNLEVPAMAQVVNTLAHGGVILPQPCITVEQVYTQIVKLLGGKN